MNSVLHMLIAQAPASRTYYEVMRLRQLDEWWHWLLLVLACGIVFTAVATMYVFDSRLIAKRETVASAWAASARVRGIVCLLSRCAEADGAEVGEE